MSSKRLWRLTAGLAIAVAAVLLSGVLQSSARAATSEATINTSLSTIGSVDMKKVIANYSKEAQSEADFQKVVDQYDDAWNTQKQNYMLSSTDQQTLGTLLLKSDQTPADQAQIKQLETQSQSDASELAALQNKTAPSDADKVRLAALTQEQQASQQILQDAGDGYKQALDAKNQAASDAIESDIRTAVAAVAQQKGLTMVLDSSLAIYATNDITELVINKLNASSK